MGTRMTTIHRRTSTINQGHSARPSVVSLYGGRMPTSSTLKKTTPLTTEKAVMEEDEYVEKDTENLDIDLDSDGGGKKKLLGAA